MNLAKQNTKKLVSFLLEGASHLSMQKFYCDFNFYAESSFKDRFKTSFGRCSLHICGYHTLLAKFRLECSECDCYKPRLYRQAMHAKAV